jgi:hypothetical protein
MNNQTVTWILRLIPAVLIGQTLFFKFSGAPESVDLFRDLAVSAFGNPSLEPALRLGTGVIELLTVVLLLIPKHSLKGAILAAGTMAGALASHLFFIGFEGHDQLATMGAIALLAASIYVFLQKEELLKLFGCLKKCPDALQQ